MPNISTPRTKNMFDINFLKASFHVRLTLPIHNRGDVSRILVDGEKRPKQSQLVMFGLSYSSLILHKNNIYLSPLQFLSSVNNTKSTIYENSIKQKLFSSKDQTLIIRCQSHVFHPYLNTVLRETILGRIKNC